MLCTGCQKNESVKNSSMQEESFLLEQDDQPNLEILGEPSLQLEQGYLFPIVGIMTYYFDWNTKQVVPFCNKTECTHEIGKDCSAMQEMDKIGYYKGKIYFTTDMPYNDELQGLSLYRMEKDGTNKELLYDYCVMDDEHVSGPGICANACMHRGYLYYPYQHYDKKEKKYLGGFARRKMEKDAKEEIIITKTGYSVQCGIMKGYGSKVYFEIIDYDKENKEYYQELYSYDIVSGETKVVEESTYEDGTSKFLGYTVIDGNVFYKSKDKVIKIDKESGKETVIFDAEDIQDMMGEQEWKESRLYGDRQYLYISNEYGEDIQNKLLVLDEMGKVVDLIKIGEQEGNDTHFLGSDENLMLFNKSTEKEYVLFYYDKSQVGTGKFEKHEIIKKEH